MSVSDLHEGQLHRKTQHSIAGAGYLRTEPGSQAMGDLGVQQSHSASVPQPQATMRATTHSLTVPHVSAFGQNTRPEGCATPEKAGTCPGLLGGLDNTASLGRGFLGP